jgi:hypothetical protein
MRFLPTTIDFHNEPCNVSVLSCRSVFLFEFYNLCKLFQGADDLGDSSVPNVVVPAQIR